MSKAKTKPNFKPDFQIDDDVLVDVGQGRTRAGWCIDIVPCAVVRWYTKNGNLRSGCAYVPLEKTQRLDGRKVEKKKGSRA